MNKIMAVSIASNLVGYIIIAICTLFSLADFKGELLLVFALYSILIIVFAWNFSNDKEIRDDVIE